MVDTLVKMGFRVRAFEVVKWIKDHEGLACLQSPHG